MSAMKELFELAAKDERIAFEVEHSVREALEQFVRDKDCLCS